MKKFKELSKKKVSLVEKDILEKFKKEDILNKTIENRKGCENFVFYDGPATANGMPGVHHMLAKLLKDTFCKYKTMQGYRVVRKVGWDTHGLPVELGVEKKLGFSNKNDIEKYGIKEFNEKCRESVWENEAAFRDLTEEMGQFIDLKHPYVTYDNNYIETEWWILKKFFDEGLIYEGYKILPYCPRCGTGLASHEVAQGYKDVQVNTVTVPFKLKNEDAYFLVWTTTPWTLLANVAICVNPNEEYIKVNSKGYKFIVAKKLADKVLGEGYEVLETYKGTDLEYTEYEQLLPFINVNKKAFFVVCDTYVTMEDGTGLVHIAPAFGQDDYEVGRKYDLPVINPVAEDGTYKEGPWASRFVMDKDLEIDIIKYLKDNDKLFKKEKLNHNYPHCWRCQTPLLYYSKPSLYIETTKFKDKVIENNKKINWYPSYVGEKRFGNWLENMNDWAISRNRYWGCPIPLWKCSCGHMEMIGSREELINKSIEKIDESIELHRPYVDDIHIKCPNCGKIMNRIPEVMDCWFDSGSMPFAQYHYPFENKELWEEQFPADFISEGIDQTRGWFYVLLIISTFVTGKSPFKNVLVNDLLLDKYGQKMHKSRGNAINPFEIINEYGADTIRWYMPYVSPVWTPIKFDVEGLKEVYSKFFNTLKNTYNFFALYANTDELDPREFNVPYENREEIDKWILSKYNKLIKYCTDAYNSYDLTKVVRSVTDFVSEDLSNWYIRRNRRRFWASELDDNKKAVYNTTYEVLEGLCKLIAPIVPFVSEEIYTNLTNEQSVHLQDFPVYDETKINEVIEEKMDLVRELISLGRNAREEAKIKVRQPISEIILDGKNKAVINDLVDLIKEELNVKNVIFTQDLNEYISYDIKPNFKVCGPILGKNIKEFQDKLKDFTQDNISTLENGNTITLNISGNDIDITYDMLDIRINSKEGFNASNEGNNFIILNTTLTDELIDEGIVREFVSKVQQIRKTNDYEMMDNINIYYSHNEKFNKSIKNYIDFIKKETLAIDLIESDENYENTYDLNGIELGIRLEKRN
ncbi:MAG: isoleucine--tRNA ligase [bacterium]|nr:isoleucine--tRNA ligase [bacterium]MDY4108546.1 isoleucine--tRNA ligase [Bacilli bacterium]